MNQSTSNLQSLPLEEDNIMDCNCVHRQFYSHKDQHNNNYQAVKAKYWENYPKYRLTNKSTYLMASKSWIYLKSELQVFTEISS